MPVRCLFSLAVVTTLAAQDSQFGIQSRLVLVPVTVTDAKGRIIDGLEPKDFIVLDNGNPRTVTVDTVATGVSPIALVVAIQASGISEPVIEKVRKIGAMIQPLVTGERGCAAVVSFSERIDWLQECTHSEDALANAFGQVRHGEAKSARIRLQLTLRFSVRRASAMYRKSIRASIQATINMAPWCSCLQLHCFVTSGPR